MKNRKPVQYLTREYVEQTRHATPDQIVRFLEESQRLYQAKVEKSTLISIRIPEDLLSAFKAKADVMGVKYQSLIKDLMRQALRAKK